ncbi:class I SAM-dependent methyltransferase [Hahella sp. HN01]|uniref:class I SAM-dependent methyltransferase n=1 Tax=Hahella sp. HN01 TaxID=2847262 RepID=UPI001C1E92EA|nr:class I SAM-dependent methyltransferase [Hahella sp. HN01]MBU6953709.1 class I SAM-dependent methyltransferase [Hahella sp. HN01]
MISYDNQVLVSYCEQRRDEAEAFSSRFGLPLVALEALPAKSDKSVYLLNFSDARVELVNWRMQAPGPVFVDFVEGALAYRREHGGGRGEMVAKAVGLKGDVKRLNVLDATAGLGRDAYVLAALGCHVVMYERNPLVHCLLADGLRRAQDCSDAASVAARMTLHLGEAFAVFPDGIDVVYLDPMFPERRKSSAVKKEMQAFKDIVGADPDADELLASALRQDVKRIVVKRPKGAPCLLGREPSFAVTGKSGRFDVYALRKLTGG